MTSCHDFIIYRGVLYGYLGGVVGNSGADAGLGEQLCWFIVRSCLEYMPPFHMHPDESG
jgi:hypothetical protein